MPLKILMPALSPTMTEGNLVKWHKKEGDRVKIGEVLAEIETDKATMEVEAVDEGILGRIFVPEGTEEVKVNTLIAALLEEGEEASALEALETASPATASSNAAVQQEPAVPAGLGLQKPVDLQSARPQGIQSPMPSSEQKREGRDVFATPVARRLAQQHNLSLEAISGSGPRGRIIKADVESILQGQEARPGRGPRPTLVPMLRSQDLVPPATEIKLNNMRKVIAKRLSESKQSIPHFYLSVDCQLDRLLQVREELNEDLEKENRLSVNDFMIKAVAAAMVEVPEANASFADDHIKIYQRVDVSVAVAIEGGLVTPIIRDAAYKDLWTLSVEMKDLAKRARAGSLRPEEFQGGTVSISNLGMFGIKNFSAVINPPQGCILAIGAGEKRPIVSENGDLEIATMMSCTLSVDHRVVDGAVGATFLQAFKKYVEHPLKLIL